MAVEGGEDGHAGDADADELFGGAGDMLSQPKHVGIRRRGGGLRT